MVRRAARPHGPQDRAPDGWAGHGPLARLPRLLWALVVVFAVLGFGIVASRPAAPPADRVLSPDVAAAARAIDDLLHPQDPRRDALADLPPDFTEVSHVVPGHLLAPDGTLRSVHTDGGCSTPWGDDNTRWNYGAGCKAHDLGYDLLRYAAAKGEPLGPQVRHDLDDRLSADMHHMCDLDPQGSPGTCRLVASIYSAGLVVNSWHQRWGPPRGDPLGSWALGLLVVALLLAVRVPSLVRPRRATAELTAHRHEPTPAGAFSLLRIASLAAIVLGESVLALVHWGPGEPSWLWPLTWVFQLAPVFFFAGGHANLLAWRAATRQGIGFGGYLAGRMCWLIRPVLAFVTAWLLVPLALELLDVPADAVTAVGRLVVQPLWLLGLYLIAVAATPLVDALHRRSPWVGAGVVAAAAVLVGLLGPSAVAGEVSGVVLALTFQQLAVLHVDGVLARVPRWAVLAAALAALAGLVALTTVGGHPKVLIAEPTDTSVLAPSVTGVLLLGLVQVGVLTCYRGARPPLTRPLTSSLTRLLGVARTAPMTAYLGYLCVVLLVAGGIAVVRTGGAVELAADWLGRPRTWFAVLLLGVPTALAFVWFERRRPFTMPLPRPGSLTDGVAAALGVGYTALGVLGFAVTSLTGVDQTPDLFGLPLDPMGNLIHLLLGWNLLHAVRIGTTARPTPWLATALASVPPMMTTTAASVTAVHGATLVVALLCALVAEVQLLRGPVAVPTATTG